MGLFTKLFHPSYKNKQGYVQDYDPSSPDANRNGYAPRHREKYRKAYGEIPEGYVVHHVDGDKTNNKAKNLVAMPRDEHNKHHHMYFKKKGH